MSDGNVIRTSHATRVVGSKNEDITDHVNEALRVIQVGGGGVGGGGTSSSDEAAYSPGTTAGTPAMGAVDETAPDDAPEGSVAIIRATLKRALHVNLRKADGTEGLPLPDGAATEATLAALAAKDFATQATLATRASETTLASRASETTAQAVADRLGALADPAAGSANKHLADIVAKDFATEATLGGVKTGTDRLDIALTVLRDAIAGASPNTKTLHDVYAIVETLLTSLRDEGRGAIDYRYIDVDLSTGALTNNDPLAEDVVIRWVKVMRYDGANDSLTVKIGTTSSPAIHMNKLTRPDTDTFFEGRLTGRVYLTQAAGQTGARFRAIVGVEA